MIWVTRLDEDSEPALGDRNLLSISTTHSLLLIISAVTAGKPSPTITSGHTTVSELTAPTSKKQYTYVQPAPYINHYIHQPPGSTQYLTARTSQASLHPPT